MELHVRPSLCEHIEVSVANNGHDTAAVAEKTFSTSVSEKMLVITENEMHLSNIETDTPIQLVDLHVPIMMHNLHLRISLALGNVHLHEKIEGNVTIAAGRGNVHVDKVRGSILELNAHKGSITVNSLVEGQHVTLHAQQVHCKRLMAKRADIKLVKATNTSSSSSSSSSNISPSLDSTFGAMYVTEAFLFGGYCTGALRIGNLHGALDIISEGKSCQCLLHSIIMITHDTPILLFYSVLFHSSRQCPWKCSRPRPWGRLPRDGTF
jgi:hypothetical protein